MNDERKQLTRVLVVLGGAVGLWGLWPARLVPETNRASEDPGAAAPAAVATAWPRSFVRPAQAHSPAPSTPEPAAAARVDFAWVQHYWDAAEFAGADLDRLEALGWIGEPDARFAYLSSELRPPLAALLRERAEARRVLDADQRLTAWEKGEAWRVTTRSFDERITQFLGSDNRDEYDKRESEPAHVLRDLQRQGLGLTREQFDLALDIERAARAMTEAGGNAREWRETEWLRRLPPDAVQRWSMLTDPEFPALRAAAEELGLAGSQIATLWQTYADFERRGLRPSYEDPLLPDAERGAILASAQAEAVARMAATFAGPTQFAAFRDHVAHPFSSVFETSETSPNNQPETTP